MPEHLHFSPFAWTLLELLQQQAHVSVEVVHVWLDPVRQRASGEFAGAIEEPGVAEEVLKAIKTGEVRVDTSRRMTIGVFPLRRAREIVGCVIVARRPVSPDRPADTPADVQAVEGAGALARTALESDLTLNAQVSQAMAVTRRLHGILRFLGQLGSYESEREIMNAVLQAATVWFDLDCRIYQRQPDGSFALAGALPGAEPPATGARLDAARAQQLLAARRFPSAGDLDDLGLSGRRDEVLLLPVGVGQPEWIILLAGSLEANVELTFAAIARVLAGELQGRELARIEHWQDRLTNLPPEVVRAPDRLVARFLEELMKDVGATAGRLTLVREGSARLLTMVGQPAPPDVEAAAIVSSFPVSAVASVRLELWTAAPAVSVAGTVQAWAKAVRSRLTEPLMGAVTGKQTELPTGPTPFEQRIEEEVERAKRFNLGLGLVLIGASDAAQAAAVASALVDVVRPELRASDLLGRIRGDRVAVLLVHAGSEGAESVATRLRQRLSERPPVTSVQMGKAMFSSECASAEELIAQALRQAQKLSLSN